MVKNDLINKIIKASGNEDAALLEDSKVLNSDKVFNTDIPAINIALTGSIDGEYQSGTLVIAGPSKHFKTLYALKIASSYMEKYDDAVMVLFDSEKGASKKYFGMFNIDTNRVVHLPVTSVEDLRSQQAKILEDIKRGDNVIFIIDSIGNLPSMKEVQDALDDKQVADMTRAKQVKSWTRIVCNKIANKHLFQIIIGHTYSTMEMYAKQVVSSGTGIYYNANDIWIIGRSQDKETSGDKELKGFTFTINIEKSRSVREKSKIPVSVSFDEGIDKYSGLLDIALDGQFIISPSSGWYQLPDTDQKVRKKDIQPLLDECLKNDEFKKYVEKTFML